MPEFLYGIGIRALIRLVNHETKKTPFPSHEPVLPVTATAEGILLDVEIGLKKTQELMHERWTAENTRCGLPQYIRLARRLSEVAVHEREPLEFALVVARGDFVSKHLEKITPLRADGAGLRIFDAVSGTIQDTGLKELVSLIRGNYRFFQGKDRLLLCTPSGEVLFLGRTLGSSSLELSRVPPKGESLASEDECYILHTRADLSVEVFQAGVLKLLFKSGGWKLPDRYGDQFKESFRDEVRRKLKLKATLSALAVLSDVVWDLVSRIRHGALFVFGEIANQKEVLGYPMTKVLPFAEGLKLATPALKDTLQELAVQDGVTFVDSQSSEVYGRRFLTVGTRQTIRLKADEWHWGARRRSAKLVTVDHPQLVSVAVSVDGTVDVFHSGRRLVKACYPD